MKRIYENVEVINNLVNNILDVSRIEKDRIELYQTSKDIVNLVKNVFMLQISYRFNKGKSVRSTEKKIEQEEEKKSKGLF